MVAIDFLSGILRSAQYRYWQIRKPHSTDFVSMGFGISARKRRFSQHWKGHLENSRNFINRATRGIGGKVAVCGSGRLYDIDLLEVAKQCSSIDLYDADPTCSTAHKKELTNLSTAPPVRFYERDLTGVIQRWTDEFEKIASTNGVSHEELAESLEGLRASPFQIDNSPSLIVSLNLLGQIPVYWRDRVLEILQKYRCIERGARELELPLRVQTALEVSMRELQSNHLKGLNASDASRIVLLTDVRYSYYLPTKSDWEDCDALYVPLSELDLPNYTVEEAEQWWWDIVPPGGEGAPYGEVHLVQATHYHKRIR